MMTSPKLAFVLTILFFALSACGSLESAKIDVKRATATPGVAGLSQSQFAASCAQDGGRLAVNNAAVCLKREIKPLLNADAGGAATGANLVIDPAMVSGKFIAATAGANHAAGSVDILYDGRLLSQVPARLAINLAGQPSGRPLTFFINSLNYKDVSVTIWSCYQGNTTNRVTCNPTWIP